MTTSPSINPDFPTTEPRLRAALRELVATRAAGDPTVPALVSEPDLFLRLCPAPTIGVTGTKGKTTTSALTAAILAADPSHPAVLGGNIGIPIVERLLELTPDHRVVYELSELQLPTLSRGTTVAVYTNVTSDHLDRHGSLEAYRRVKRSLAERVDPTGAVVLNAEDPVVAAYAGIGRAPAVMVRRSRPMAGGLGVVDGWIVADGTRRLPSAGGGRAATGPGGRIMPVGELAIPGAHNVSNALAAIAVGLLFGVAPDAIREAAASFTGVEHRLESVALIDGVRFVNDSQGTQPDAVIAALRAFEPPIVLIAGGRDKGVDLDELVTVVAERAVAAVVIGETGPALGRRFAAAGVGHGRGSRNDGRRGPSCRRHRARRPRRGRTGRGARDRAAQPRRGQLRHVCRLRRSRPRVQGVGGRVGRRSDWEGPMNLAPPIPRFGRPTEADEREVARRTGVSRRAANRTPTKDLTQVLQRERHEPDYLILVVVVALAAVGILMVYSSSAMRGYLSADADTFATVGPQIQWALLGIVAMVVMMRIDYRYLRLVSIPAYVAGLVLLVLVFVPSLNIVVGGSARWLKLGPLPAIHPAEIAKLALIIYLAHWFAKRGTKVSGFWRGTVPFLVIAGPVIALVFSEPDLGTTIVITLTSFMILFVAGANLLHLGGLFGMAGMAAIFVGLQGYQIDRIRAWLNPWEYADTIGYHTVQGLLALGMGGLFGSGLGESRMAGGLFVPNAFNDFIFAIIGEEFGLVGAGVVIALFVAAGLRWYPGRPVGPRHLRGPARDGDHRLAVHPGVHQHRRRRHAGPDHRHHAAVHQCRRFVADHQFRGDRHPALDLARDRRQGDLERRCDC